ncbi:MAG: hypothetical protein HKO95_15060 [Rhodobacteraceae bacterium]|nr:hypothetical protein [Paracoccaceae bacterium]
MRVRTGDMGFLSKAITVAISGTLLAGCNVSLRFGDEPLLDDRIDSFNTLLAQQQAQVITPTASLPPSATYTGLAVLQTSGETLSGTVALGADFVGGSVGGSVDNVISGRSGRLNGRLDVTSGMVTATPTPSGPEAGFQADLDGSLIGDGRLLTVDAGLEGNFRGPAAEGLIADLTAGSTLTEGAFVTPLIGTLVAD